jgi:hypothetical protein
MDSVAEAIPPQKPSKGAADRLKKWADDRRRREAKRSRDRLAAGNSVGRIPECKNPLRRAMAEKSLQAWMETYLISLFTNKKGEHFPWSPTQIEAMATAEKVIRFGRRFAIALRRGGFKTGLCKAAILFGAFTGLQGWTCIIAATSEKANKILESLKLVLEASIALRDDYPEICIPIRALNSQPNRALRQTYTLRREELPTRMRWEQDRIIFPDIFNAPGRQAIITTAGLTGSDIRGLVTTTGELRDRRPTCLLFDDVETDESATSDLQTPKRMELVDTAMYMNGPGDPLAAFYAGTVIAGDSVCARILSAPGWHSALKPAMPAMPLHCAETLPEIEHRDLWGEYGELLRLKDPDEAREKSTALYQRYQAKPECLPILDQPRPCADCELRNRCMDADARVDWVHAKDPHHLTAIQFCMDQYLLKPDKFFSEFQQAPRGAKSDGLRVLPEQIRQRVNGYPRDIVPSECAELTFGIDVQLHYLAYVVAGWERDFTGYNVTYGTWPDQGRRHFSKINPPHPLRLLYPGLEQGAMLQAGILDLLKNLKGRDFAIAGGLRTMQITRGLIDSRFGTKMVMGAIRRAQWGNVAQPSKGIAISPGRKPISMYDETKEGYRIGDNWFSGPVKGTQEAPHYSVNVAPWKSRLHKALSLAVGTRGGFSLFGTEAECRQHELYSNHVGGSERPRPPIIDSFGNEIVMWDVIAGGAENEYLDASVLAMVAASIQGIKLGIAIEPKKEQNRRIIHASPARSGYTDPAYS